MEILTGNSLELDRIDIFGGESDKSFLMIHVAIMWNHAHNVITAQQLRVAPIKLYIV